ncbi:hypothetical protein ACLOJK_021089 [Asimina triloba]
MGNCLPLPATSNKAENLPIQTAFKFPSPIPTWPSGGEFAKGIINLGGLEVCQVNTFTKVWATHGGGQDSLDDSNGSSDLGSALVKPVDYTVVWSCESMKNNTDGHGYIWLPMAPKGYVAAGLTVTNSSEKPSLDEIRCVRSDLTEACENDTWLWGTKVTSSSSNFNVYSARPANRGTQALWVKPSTAMPDLIQIHALMQTYSPWVYLHPGETYFPSSVSWYFDNGALLYKQSKPTVSTPIDLTGSNLPLGRSNDWAYWLNLPIEESAKEYVKRGDLQSSKCYIHAKPMLGATFTDIAIWLFYPFNGPARAKVELVTVDLEKIGEHVGDWEHVTVTLRISNFNGVLWRVYFSEHSSGQWVDAAEIEFEGGENRPVVLWRVYFSEHSSGQWVDAAEIEFEGGENRPVAYASSHGHAMHPKAGLVLRGLSQLGIGKRNDTEKGKDGMDTGAADHLSSVHVRPAKMIL